MLIHRSPNKASKRFDHTSITESEVELLDKNCQNSYLPESGYCSYSVLVYKQTIRNSVTKVGSLLMCSYSSIDSYMRPIYGNQMNGFSEFQRVPYFLDIHDHVTSAFSNSLYWSSKVLNSSNREQNCSGYKLLQKQTSKRVITAEEASRALPIGTILQQRLTICCIVSLVTVALANTPVWQRKQVSTHVPLSGYSRDMLTSTASLFVIRDY